MKEFNKSVSANYLKLKFLIYIYMDSNKNQLSKFVEKLVKELGYKPPSA